MVHREFRVIWRNTENIVKLKTGREVMSGKVMRSPKRKLTFQFLPSTENCRMADGNSQGGEETSNFTFLSLCNKLNSANSPACSISPAVCEQHQLLSLSWMTGFFFRETSSDSSLRSGDRLQWCSGRQGCLLQELSEVVLQKVCLHNSPSLYAVRAFLHLCLLAPLDSK